MKKLLKRLEKISVTQLMEDTRQNLLMSDKAFLQDKADEVDLEKRYVTWLGLKILLGY